MNIILETQRIIVREFLASEEYLLVRLYADETVTRYVPGRTLEETKQQFAGSLKSYKDGTGLGRWGIFSAANGYFIGVCILKPADSDPSHIELGYVLNPDYWGLGIATELAKALITYGFEQKGLSEICACTHPENLASQNVLIKSGFKRDGNVFWHSAYLPLFRITRQL